MNKLINIGYRGVECSVQVLPYAGKNAQVIFREGSFIVYVNNKVKDSKKEAVVSLALYQWFHTKAEEEIPQRTAQLSKEVGVSYNQVRIKDTKTRWGSCSSKKNLNFNFRLIMAPEAVMDYVIIHELCHLKHMNHSKEFWDTVAVYMPQYEKYKNWLKENGGELYKI